MTYLSDWIVSAWQIFFSSDFMVWNLFLAFIPLVLSVWLFRRSATERSIVWWAILGVFIAFLPNAPYVLTDIIHLITAIRQNHSAMIVTLVLIPQYLIFILAGVEAYVISLINMGYYCQKIGWGKYIVWMELITHALCSLGIFLGRFQRFNSWDILTKPDHVMESIVDNLTGKWSILTIAVTFLILVVLHWLLKEITLGLILRYRQPKSL